MRSILQATLLAALLTRVADAQTTAAGPLPAQTTVLPRWGLVASSGLGAGLGDAVCADCTRASAGGLAGYARVGGAFRETIVLAVQADWWTGSSGGATPVSTTIWNTSLVLQWYPPQSHGLQFTVGMGVGFLSTDALGGFVEGTRAHGLGYHLGVGYDVPMSGHVWLTPYVSYFGTPGARSSDPRATLNARAGQVGLGLTWR